MNAYFAARTPQISLALATSTAGVSAPPPVILGSASSIITLPPAGSAQPVATVILTYPGGSSGDLVWVQPLRAGKLTANDNAGHTYDGSQGFFLTLGAAGAVTFFYQAPSSSGTYQVLTRFSNVKTTLTFRVPDATR